MQFRTVILLTMLATASAQYNITDCPSVVPQDRFLRVHGESCYYFVITHTREFSTAERECEAKHGHLVTIRNMATNNFLYGTLKNELHYNGVVFIGLSDARTEGTWVWTDGSSPTFTNWAPGQPGWVSFAEDCAAIDISKGPTWHDYACEDVLFVTEQHAFVCEYPVVKTTTTAPSMTTPIASTTVPATTPEETTPEPTL